MISNWSKISDFPFPSLVWEKYGFIYGRIWLIATSFLVSNNINEYQPIRDLLDQMVKITGHTYWLMVTIQYLSILTMKSVMNDKEETVGYMWVIILNWVISACFHLTLCLQLWPNNVYSSAFLNYFIRIQSLEYSYSEHLSAAGFFCNKCA